MGSTQHAWEEERHIRGFGGETTGKITAKDVGGSSRSEVRGMDWIYLAQDRDRWQALVNALMNLQVP